MKLDRLKIWICGSYQQWYRRLLPMYGSWRKRQLEVRIQKEQKKALYRITLCTLIFALCGCGLLVSWMVHGEKGKAELKQVLNDGGSWTLRYDDARRDISVEPLVSSEQPDLEEEEIFRRARREISREMLGNNPDWNHVSGALQFPNSLSSGIAVYYETSDPTRISEKGLVDGMGAEDGIPVDIRVTMLLGTTVESYTIPCIVVPPVTKEDAAQALQLREETLKTTLKRIEEGNASAFDLEKTLEGIELTAADGFHELWVLLSLSVFLWIVLFAGRFAEVEQQREQKKKALAEEVPMLMEQLILMMNAGLILTEALEMAALSAVQFRKEEASLCSDICFLCRWAEETKRPLPALLCEYAVETGCPELVRFSTLLLDHVDRGSAALIQQLKMERNYAMETQWKEKEARCRQMEVQLSGPLLLLLSVILLITIGPVMVGV